MKRLFLLTVILGSASVFSFGDTPHHILWVSRGDDHGVLVPLAVAVEDKWSSINPASTPLAWMLNGTDGERVPVKVLDTKQTICGPVQLIDRDHGVPGALAVNPAVRVSYFKPLPDNSPSYKALRTATQKKGKGEWIFESTDALLPDWTVFGYEERLRNRDETGTVYGILVKHGKTALQVYDIGEAYHGKRGTLDGRMIGLFVWKDVLYLVETQEQEDVVTTRLLVVTDNLSEAFKRECTPA